VPTLYFAFQFRAFGRPMFIFLLFSMILLATTELGTESWISDLLTPGLQGFSAHAGTWVFIYTSALMFGLRFFAGRLAHRLGPVGLLIGCSLMAAAGLVWLAHAGTAPLPTFAAATLFGAGTAFFWPTTLGLAAEQFPRGGPLTLNAISAVGMISVGILGGPLIGTLQEVSLDQSLRSASPALHDAIAGPAQRKFGVDFRPLDKVKIALLSGPDRARVHEVITRTDQALLGRIAVLPSIMCAGFLGLGLFFRIRGGYRQVELVPR
jgi:MFS family permease